MAHTMLLVGRNGDTLELPAQHYNSRLFSADHPTRAPIVVQEARFVSDALPRPVRWLIDGMNIDSDEAGVWELSLWELENGETRYHLEYRMTEQHGKSLRHPLVISWDHRKDEMVGN